MPVEQEGLRRYKSRLDKVAGINASTSLRRGEGKAADAYFSDLGSTDDGAAETSAADALWSLLASETDSRLRKRRR